MSQSNHNHSVLLDLRANFHSFYSVTPNQDIGIEVYEMCKAGSSDRASRNFILKLENYQQMYEKCHVASVPLNIAHVSQHLK